MKTQLDALDAASGELAFLAGHIDMKRLGLSGHSQGACMSAVNSYLANVQIIVPLTGSLPALNDCGSIAWKRGVEITTYVSTLALEEQLHCVDRSQQFANLQAAIPELGDYRHEP